MDIYPADLTTPLGQTRLLVPDMAQDDSGNYIFTDAQILALLALYRDSIPRAAAQALDILATDQALLLKVVRTDDLNVDGVKIAAELRARAKGLRDQADKDDFEDAMDDGFQIVYPDVPHWDYPEAVPRWV
jgi:hypothetical protein